MHLPESNYEFLISHSKEKQKTLLLIDRCVKYFGAPGKIIIGNII